MRPLNDLGSRLSDLIIVSDNAPCYSRLEIIDLTGATMLRLAPYSPMLSLIEQIWEKLKMEIKTSLRISKVATPRIQEQKLQCMKQIDVSKETIMAGNCAQHTNMPQC